MTRITGADGASGGIVRTYLHDEVADRLRELISRGEIAPGERLPEASLCARFGISRTPLREAIKILATEGLLELLPNRGARVTTLTPDVIDDMIEVIAGIEATAGDLACRRITDEEVARIAAMTAEMEAAYGAGDIHGYFALNRRIHDAILAAARNTTLAQVLASLQGRVQTLRYTVNKTPAQWARALADHRAMVEHLKARDAEALRDLLRDHVRGQGEVVMGAVLSSTSTGLVENVSSIGQA